MLAACSKPPVPASGAQAWRTDGVPSPTPASRMASAARPSAPGDPLAVQQQSQPPTEMVTSAVRDSSLPIEPFEPAVLRLPADGRPAPLFVITHGAGGTAEWHCQQYATLLGPNCTLLCLKGKRMFANDPSRGYYYPDHLALGLEVSRARESIFGRHADRIDASAVVYVGYSQGASMGVLATAEHGDWFPRMLLVEGGYETWSTALVKKYAGSGGRRVLFVCGTERCRKMAALNVSLLRQNHVRAQLRVAPGAGHRPDGPVAEEVRKGLPWLLADSME